MSCLLIHAPIKVTIFWHIPSVSVKLINFLFIYWSTCHTFLGVHVYENKKKQKQIKAWKLYFGNWLPISFWRSRYRTDDASYNKYFYFSECTAKTYGLECQRVCGNCRNGDPCHHVNGSCINGCDKGTFGVRCDTGLLVYLDENG